MPLSLHENYPPLSVHPPDHKSKQKDKTKLDLPVFTRRTNDAFFNFPLTKKKKKMELFDLAVMSQFII